MFGLTRGATVAFRVGTRGPIFRFGVRMKFCAWAAECRTTAPDRVTALSASAAGRSFVHKVAMSWWRMGDQIRQRKRLRRGNRETDDLLVLQPVDEACRLILRHR